jgi:hypothetical protein
MGNVQEKSLREIWNGERYVQLRNELSGREKVREHCIQCSHVGQPRLTRRAFREQPIDLYNL